MKPTAIVLHHSLTDDGQTVSWSAIRRYHMQKGWTDIGYHFGIEIVGTQYEILVGRMLNEIGAHTVGMNKTSIGICFVGNFDIYEPPDAQLIVGRRLVRSLMEVLDVPKTRVYGHKDFAQKSCPGKLFLLKDFVGGL